MNEFMSPWVHEFNEYGYGYVKRYDGMYVKRYEFWSYESMNLNQWIQWINDQSMNELNNLIWINESVQSALLKRLEST